MQWGAEERIMIGHRSLLKTTFSPKPRKYLLPPFQKAFDLLDTVDSHYNTFY
jgi:hypothetical protein